MCLCEIVCVGHVFVFWCIHTRPIHSKFQSLFTIFPFSSFLKWSLHSTCIYNSYCTVPSIVDLIWIIAIVLKHTVFHVGRKCRTKQKKNDKKKEKENKNNVRISGRNADVHLPLATRYVWDSSRLSHYSLIASPFFDFMCICMTMYNNEMKKRNCSMCWYLVFNSYFYIYSINFHFTK